MRVEPKPELAPMMVAQISKPGGNFEIVEREVPELAQGRCGSKCRPAACATVTY